MMADTNAESVKTKRRCAGCNRVIDGRANKLYCSKACKKKGLRQREKGTETVPFSGPVPSVIRGSNGVLIARVAQLGYIQPPVLDMTYGRGGFWTRYRPVDTEACNGLFPWTGNFLEIPEDGTFPTVVFDPPYISTGSRATSSVDDLYDRYGLGDLKGWRAIRQLIDEGMSKAHKLLADDGLLLVKCMDYVESGRKVWNTFHVAAQGEALGLQLVDRFHHLTGGGPQPMTNLDGSPREQKRSREVASMLLVFTK